MVVAVGRLDVLYEPSKKECLNVTDRVKCTTHKLCAHVIVVAEVHGKEFLVTGIMDPNISY